MAYRRLLDTYYTTEKPLPADHRACCRLAMATTDAQREAVRVVLEEFFELTPEGWRNRRADSEIEAMRAKQEKQREKANKRWQKPVTDAGTAPAMPRHKESDAAASENHADAMPPTPTPTPTPVNQDQERERAADAASPSQPRQHRGTRLPDDWQPDAELVTWTRAEAPSVDVARTFAQFRDYWRAQPGQKGVKTDWPATWRNWVRREAATVRGAGGPRAGPPENLQQRVARKNGLDRLFGEDDGQAGGALGRDGGHLRLALVE